MRLTSRAAGLFCAGALMLGAGLSLGYPELVIVGVACLLGILGGLAKVAWRPRLRVRRMIAPERVSRGEPCGVVLEITNLGRLFGVSLLTRDPVRGGGQISLPSLRIAARDTVRLRYPIPTDRRGVIDLGPIEVTRRDRLAVAQAVRPVGPGGRVWVRPRIHPISVVPAGLSRSMDGQVDRVPLGSITFAALREYVAGDDLRRVHWRTSARVGDLMVREQVDTSVPRLVVLLDNRASAHEMAQAGESTFEYACEAAASLIAATVASEIELELSLVIGEAKALPARAAGGGRAWGAIAAQVQLDLLAEAQLEADADASGLRSATQRLRVRRMGDTLVYLTGPTNHDELGMIAGLRGAYPSVIVGVFGPVEPVLSTMAGVLVVGAVDGAGFAAAWEGLRAW